MIIIATILSFLALLMSLLLFIQLKAPWGFVVLFPKLAAAALSPLWCLCGIVGALLGWLSGAWPAVAAGGVAVLCMAWYMWTVTSGRGPYATAFEEEKVKQPAANPPAHILKHHWIPYLPDPKKGEPRWERNIPFWTISGTDRQLLCDVWQPPEGIPASGLALIFLHGSAWMVFDKDYGTRPFFRQLAAQGHVIMDVSYRLCPEVGIQDMVGDVKRAVAWMKAHANHYGVDPKRIVLGGASAGGHLSMLAAYAPNHPWMTPEEIRENDLSVAGVLTYYGPSDLRAVYEHTSQQRLVDLSRVPLGDADALGKSKFANSGRLDILLQGHPSEVPEAYDLASPITHVHPGCPPTLFIQGEQDLITPVAATRIIYNKLKKMGVPAVNIVYPCTNHMFDLVLPRLSPVSQSALYEVERFLALL
jgi:acetyl esterase/lipase